MSDTEDEGTYEDRTHDEIEALEERFRAPAGTNYVAKAAPGWDTHGIWHAFGAGHRTGYATHAVSLHWMLTQLGITTQLIPHRNLDIDIEAFPEDRYDMLFEWHKNAVGFPHLLFSSFPPEVSAELDGLGPPLIPYCAFEGTKVSKVCRDLCTGPAFASIWVVSESIKRAMVEGGVPEERVRVVRPMLWGGPWKGLSMERLRAHAEADFANGWAGTEDDPFLFGAMGTWQKRKGWHDLLRAYFGAFKRSDPVKLVIRTSAFGEMVSIRQLKELVTEDVAAIAAEFGDNNFPQSKAMPKLQFLLGTDETDQGVIDWLGSLDCYANATYGEGLGIPHVWAKAQGVPMISSTYGAVGEMLGDLMAAGAVHDQLVPHRLVPVDPEMLRIALMFDRDCEWGAYDVESFGEAMSIQFEQGRRVDVEGAAVTREVFSPEVCVPAVREGLRALLDEEWAAKWNL
jgi:glycosyltransferase involved in cell wall biosynthesis